MYIEEMREKIPPPSHNTMGVCNQITLFIPYYITSSLITFLKILDAPKQVSDIFDLKFSFKFINFAFRYSFFMFLKCLLATRHTLFM